MVFLYYLYDNGQYTIMSFAQNRRNVAPLWKWSKTHEVNVKDWIVIWLRSKTHHRDVLSSFNDFSKLYLYFRISIWLNSSPTSVLLFGLKQKSKLNSSWSLLVVLRNLVFGFNAAENRPKTRKQSITIFMQWKFR